MPFVEKTLKSEQLYDAGFFKMHKDIVEARGGQSVRILIDHNGAVAVAALTPENKLLMVRQYRKSYEKVLLEIPAGKLEKDEDPMACAIRELKEETGMQAEKVESLGQMYATPGYCSEIIHLFLATGLSFGEGNPDDGEFLQLVKMPLSEAIEKIETNEISDAKTMVALLKTARRVGV